MEGLDHSHILQIVHQMNQFDQEDKDFLVNKYQGCMQKANEFDKAKRAIGDAAGDLLGESKRDLMSRTKNEFSPEELEKAHDEWQQNLTNFMFALKEIFTNLHEGYKQTAEHIKMMSPRSLMLEESTIKQPEPGNFREVIEQINFNNVAISRFYSAYDNLDEVRKIPGHLVRNVRQIMEGYYKHLLDRHSKEGVPLVQNAVITDMAVTIYENIDKHGEINKGKGEEQVSRYTSRKAELVAKAAREHYVKLFLKDPEELIKMVTNGIGDLKSNIEEVYQNFEEVKEAVAPSDWMGFKFDDPNSTDLEQFNKESFEEEMRDLNPMNISEAEDNSAMSNADKFEQESYRETLEKMVNMLNDEGTSAQDLVEYVLRRKRELRDFFMAENSFYKCKIGEGNTMMGESPGSLKVIPAERPTASVNDVVGSGFDEIREFLDAIKQSHKWQDLFIATSPNKTADKSNVLMIGPQGCGKTEVLRAVGAEKDSIGIYAQGSDFLTCWAGEADKNPKRLFEQGLQLAKESGMHVNFLIDEIDEVMNNDWQPGKPNLTIEFQMLMDGVLHYPNLSVWGTTNNPERIPMPMIRRFNKVSIVGELTKQHRIELLKHFLSYLPLEESEMPFGNNRVWGEFADKLEGATGDILRKVADEIWRRTMRQFVDEQPENADKVVQKLYEINSGDKFSINEFSSEQRREFKNHLAQFFTVTRHTVEQTIDEFLNSIAISSEIKTAQETYEKSRKILNPKAEKVSVT